MTQAAAAVEREFGTPPVLAVSFRQLRQHPGLAFRLLLRRFDVAVAYLMDIEVPLYRDFFLAYLFTLRAGRKALRDPHGREIPVGWREGLQAVGHCVADLIGFPVVYLLARWKARALSRARPRRQPSCLLLRRVAYLRANPWQESQAGGSLAHATGVLTGLKAAGVDVTYIGTTEFPPALRLGLRTWVVPARLRWFRNLLPFLVYGEIFGRRSSALLAAEPPDFVYQRYSLLNYSGAEVAGRLRCPFVLEYNGSEVWIARNWSTPLFFEGLADRIEQANLRAADLTVVV
ncbi:MAG: hypothetical protein HY613_08630, partial [Candidatus Rokubacteria bacterium]|nr:hypothetical protein [Candidatus Rokubacteria bacterium]